MITSTKLDSFFDEPSPAFTNVYNTPKTGEDPQNSEPHVQNGKGGFNDSVTKDIKNININQSDNVQYRTQVKVKQRQQQQP